jgi:hypothetical protein
MGVTNVSIGTVGRWLGNTLYRVAGRSGKNGEQKSCENGKSVHFDGIFVVGVVVTWIVEGIEDLVSSKGDADRKYLYPISCTCSVRSTRDLETNDIPLWIWMVTIVLVET